MAWKEIREAIARAWRDSYTPQPRPVRTAVNKMPFVDPDLPIDVQLRRLSLLLRHARREGDMAGECEYLERIDELLEAMPKESCDNASDTQV
jgi:hypothetical protein